MHNRIFLSRKKCEIKKSERGNDNEKIAENKSSKLHNPDVHWFEANNKMKR